MNPTFLATVLGCCMALFCLAGTAAVPTTLEKELIEALQMNAKGDDRLEDPAKTLLPKGHYASVECTDATLRTE